MRYLTKEWYETCQRTGLYIGMKVNKGASVYDEALYKRLYKRKEREFIKMQHEVYDVDPRFMLEQDGCMLVSLDKFVNGEEIAEEDKIVYHLPPDDRKHIEKMIEEYDVRPPFDEKKCKEEFRTIQETLKNRQAEEKLPYEIFQQIADMRIFNLGYCTKEVLAQLKRVSKENEKIVNCVLDECIKSQRAENIPENIREKFGFHDCKVTEFTAGKNIIIRFDTRGGFTDYNKITFVTSEIVKQEDCIVGSNWIYDELYRKENGYEAHMLLASGGLQDLIIRCKDIVIEKE